MPPVPLLSPEPKNWPAALPRPLVNSIGMRFTHVPKGKFLRGSPDSDEDAQTDERPQREIEIGKDFYLGIYEVTQAEYRRVTGASPDRRNGGNFLPVTHVKHDEAAEFCWKLAAMDEEREARRSYRLPTEAEWEYACRAGTTTRFSFGDMLTPEQANFGTNVGTLAVVGSYAPNAWGLYDMHGNAWEWCADWYGEDHYAVSRVKDPRGPRIGPIHVIRGGSWGFAPKDCRAATRHRTGKAALSHYSGFRVCFTAPD